MLGPDTALCCLVPWTPDELSGDAAAQKVPAECPCHLKAVAARLRVSLSGTATALHADSGKALSAAAMGCMVAYASLVGAAGP